MPSDRPPDNPALALAVAKRLGLAHIFERKQPVKKPVRPRRVRQPWEPN